MAIMIMMGRYYRIIHEPLLTEWLARNYPLGTWRVNVRVGPVREELLELAIEPEMRRMMKITVGSVDAVVFLPDRTILIECMIREEFGKLEHLRLYKRLFLSDPDHKDRWELPVELILLSVIMNPLLQARCEEEGIRFIYYRPTWVEQYLQSLPPRIRGPRLGGVERA